MRRRAAKRGRCAAVKSLERVRRVSFSPLLGVPEAAEAIAQILRGEPAERVVDKTLRGRRGATREERRAIAELCFGVGLWRRRAAHHAGCAPSPQDAPRVIFGFLRDLAGVASDEALRISGLLDAPPVLAPPADGAVAYSFPDWLWDDASREVGAEAAALADALNLPGPVTLRANALKTTPAALKEELRAANVATVFGAFAPHALRITDERPNIYGLEAQRRSAFDVQDEGSQLIGVAVGAMPGHRVLDFCAGAGGKTLLLGADLRNQGELHAFDVDGAKLERLRTRALHAGITTLRIHHHLPAALEMDRVLVDAPCSETGALRRGPDLRFRLDPAAIAKLPALQLGLLERAAGYVARGGRLIYATCSFRRAENEDVVDAFLAGRRSDFRVIEAPVPVAVRRGPYLRTWPHLHDADAFFAAVLERQ